MWLSVVQCEVLLSQSMRFFGKREQANLAIQLAQPLTVPLGLFELPEQEYCTSAENALKFLEPEATPGLLVCIQCCVAWCGGWDFRE